MALTDKLYSAAEVAQILGLHHSRICQICRGHGIGAKLGRDWILRESDVDRIKNLPDGRKKSAKVA